MKEIEVRNPYDDAPVAKVSLASSDDLEQALKQATNTLDSFSRTPTHVRGKILRKTVDLLEKHSEELAKLISLESGKPIRYSRAEVARAQVTFKLAESHCLTHENKSPVLDLEPRGEKRLCIVKRFPRGVIGAIAPFNYPLNLVAHKLAPAIAIGAPVILKPPMQSPLTSFRLCEILKEAGLPEGALQVLHMEPAVAEKLATDARIAVLSFTGSDSVGWHLKTLASKKQVLLELGGNAPCIVDEGVPLDSVAAALLQSAFAQAGQVCIRTQRVIVHKNIHQKLLEKLVSGAQSLKVGNPLDEDTVVGPLIEKKHLKRLNEWLFEAIAHGAKVLCGGKSEGNAFLPTVVADVPKNSKLYNEEIFGPILIVETFSDWKEAIAKANDTRFGLQAGLFTPSFDRALEAFEQLKYGGVLINETPTFRIDNFPYGGSKDSGFGREGVASTIQEYTEEKVFIYTNTCQ